MKRYFGPFKRRTKNEVVTEAVELNGTRSDYNGSQLTGGVTYPGLIPPEHHFYDSLITPEFQKKQAEGYVIQCPFTIRRESYSASPGGFSITWKAGTNPQYTSIYRNLCPMFQGHILKLGATVPEGRKAAMDEALTRVFAKANSGYADLLVDLFEIRSTIQMFAKAVRTLLALVATPGAFLDLAVAHVRGTERYVRIPPNGKRIPVTSLEGLWCELRFGWRPLLGTLEGVIKALSAIDLDKIRRVTYRATEEVNKIETNVTEVKENYTYGCVVLTNEVLVRHTEELRYRASFRAGILLEDTMSLQRALGLDARAIPIAAWDLVPYSFIVDRFVNIGNWIRSLRPIPHSEFGGSWVTERFTVEHRLRTEYLAVSRSCGAGTEYRHYNRTSGYAEGTAKVEGYTRSIHEHAPSLPTLRHDWSELQNLYNLVDALMLAIQRARPVFNNRRN